MPSLFVIRGHDQGSRFELAAPLIAVGRDAACGLQLRDTEVSRRHVELRREGTQYLLVDLGSSNGSFVNGRRVSQHLLASGDQVQLGRSLLLYTGVHPAENDLDEQIDIVGQHEAGGSSRIVRSMSQDEGSRIFQLSVDDAKSPWLARARGNLQVMYRTALAVSHTLDIDQLLHKILELIFEWVEADRGCIMLMHPQSGKLEPAARRDRQSARAGAAAPAQSARISISQTILDYVLEHKEGVLTSDAKEDTRFDAAASILQQRVHEAICVPMQGRYDIVGVIYIDTSIPPELVLQKRVATRFSEEHLKLMIAIAHQAALAVEDTRYYSAMVEAERLAAVGQTIATLSHHIKNILQGIRGGSYLIQMGLDQHSEEITRKGWAIVERRQEQISNLVMDMLTFSKEREPELVEASLNEVVADVIDLMQSRAAEFEVALDWRPDEHVPTTTFDPDGLHRAVLNLVTNAIDACLGYQEDHEQDEPANEGEALEATPAREPRVEVATQYVAEQSLLRVVVRDNGAGIRPEDLEQIFSIFVSHKGNRGTGLGLPVSQKIVHEHGGRIVVDSQLGLGSCFTIELPAVLGKKPLGVGDTNAGQVASRG